MASTGPALVAGLMQKGATLDGARSLFATILSPEVNGHIAEQLPQLLGSTTGVSQLESVGAALLERALDRRVDTLSDEVATQTGVPAHATHAMTGIVGATLLGLLKRHFLEGQGNAGQLPTLLGHQLPVIAPYLNDRLMAALGLGGLGAFTGNILSQLKAVSAHIDHPTPAAKPVAEASLEHPRARRRGGARRAPLAHVALVAARGDRCGAGVSVSARLPGRAERRPVGAHNSARSGGNRAAGFGAGSGFGRRGSRQRCRGVGTLPPAPRRAASSQRRAATGRRDRADQRQPAQLQGRRRRQADAHGHCRQRSRKDPD